MEYNEWRKVESGEDIHAGRVVDVADVILSPQGHPGMGVVFTDGVCLITDLSGHGNTTAPRRDEQS